jgi:hypothetical protein
MPVRENEKRTVSKDCVIEIEMAEGADFKQSEFDTSPPALLLFVHVVRKF